MAPLGIMVSFLVPFVFIHSDHEDTQVIRGQVGNFFTFHTALAGFMFITSVLFFHENQANDGDNNEDEDNEDSNVSVSNQLSNLFKDPPYVTLLIGFGVINASLGGLSAVLSPIVAVWGYEEVFLLLINFRILGLPVLLLGLHLAYFHR